MLRTFNNSSKFRLLFLRPNRPVICRAYTQPSAPTLSSKFSSIHDPLDTLHTKADDDTGRLRSDVRFLGTVLGNVIKETDPNVYEKVERTRSLTKSWRDGGALHQAKDYVSLFSDEDLLKVGRR